MKTIEVGGTKRDCARTSIPRERTISVHKRPYYLPNPHSVIGRGEVAPTHPAILKWLRADDARAQLVEKIIKIGVDLLETHSTIRVECLGGKHRSQVIAREISLRVPDCRIDFVDARPLALCHEQDGAQESPNKTLERK